MLKIAAWWHLWPVPMQRWCKNIEKNITAIVKICKRLLRQQTSQHKGKWILQNSSKYSENNPGLLWSNHWWWRMDNISTENWRKFLGNKNIFTLTLQGLYLRGNELWIDILNAKKIKKYVRYANFHTTDDATKYNLLVNGYTGTLNDEVKHHNRQKFSTFDSDNDAHFTTNCASIIFRAWWFNGFNSCQYSLYSGDKM